MNNRPGAFPPSPPHSVARSSNGTGLYSMSSSGGGGQPARKFNMGSIERELAEHHAVLKEFLAQSAREDKAYQPHNRARDKLLRLSPVQFQELSTDVYDELLRREDERAYPDPETAANNVPRFLLPKNTFHPKRNQARQKLSTLAVKKFRELATDVLFELERRFPQLGGSNLDRAASPAVSERSSSRNGPGGISIGVPSYAGMRRPSSNSPIQPYSPGIFENGQRSIPNSASSNNDFNRPLPKQFQSSTMVPNKSTMVEDDDDMDDQEGDHFDAARSSRRTTNKSLPYSVPGDYNPESAGQISALEAKVNELQTQLRSKEDDLRKARSAEKETVQALEAERSKSSNLASDLERQLRSAEDMNHSLQAEINRLKDENVLLAQNSASATGADEWKARYEDLEREFHDQQQTTDEVRQEAMISLQEMRLVSENAAQALENEERLSQQVTRLEASVKEWKTRYMKAKTRLRHFSASSGGLNIEQPRTTVLDGDSLDQKGLVQDHCFTHFQMCIDELLQLAHGEEPAEVLPYMRTMVSAVRAITNDIDAADSTATPGSTNEKQYAKLKARVSATANNLITSAKAVSVTKGVAPASLIDAAAASLTIAVIDMVKLVKIRHSPSANLAEDDDSEDNSDNDHNADVFELRPDVYSRLGTASTSHSPGDSIVSLYRNSVEPVLNNPPARAPMTSNGPVIDTETLSTPRLRNVRSPRESTVKNMAAVIEAYKENNVALFPQHKLLFWLKSDQEKEALLL